MSKKKKQNQKNSPKKADFNQVQVTEELRDERVPLTIFGEDQIEAGALAQINVASSLKVAVKAAIMPDAHLGYGLPIGGVLAVKDAVIPYGVGVDIGCRMCMYIYELPENYIKRYTTNLKQILERSTKFGVGAAHNKSQDHQVLDRSEFQEIPLLYRLHSRAAMQLGTSGSGNHFVDMGELDLRHPVQKLGLKAGKYFAVLSHSGSRNLGAEIASHFTKIAMNKRVLPKHACHLAWLNLHEDDGDQYWKAMNLAGDYSSACHHFIQKKIEQQLGERHVAIVENHHNFAWKEKLPDGTEVIVHRKGATPAGKGVLGIIPGTMTSNAYLVSGKGNENAINSAAHGAGRIMSRSQAMRTFTKKDMKIELEKHGVELIGGSPDESPMVYKNINKVMSRQIDLVDILGSFRPKIVRMNGKQ